jgi:hypothetical protein
MGRRAVTTGWDTRQRRLLDALIQQKGFRLGDYALFGVTGEGRLLPTSRPGEEVEEASGLLIDRGGRVFAFWLGCDAQHGEPALIDWVEVPPEPHWRTDPEYQDARQHVGLPAA